jgi:HD-like signal output (HDOD) protein
MQALAPFEDLLPDSIDPAKSAIREKLLHVLQSQGEILPSANSPRGKLWHLVNSPESSIEECAEVIKLDSALSARIFRVANSGAYGAQADNITDALLKLGLKFVREQVFNASVFKQYSGWVLPPEWDLFWLRNIFVARMSERIASAYGPTNGSEYLAGLIHDMGWLFLATYVPEEFTRLFADGRTVRETEAEFLPFGHAEISASIAVRSRLAPRAVEAILEHHAAVVPGLDTPPGKSPHFLGIVLRLSDGIADCCKMDMFSPCRRTMEEIVQGPEFLWLNHFTAMPDLWDLAEEEVQKAREIFEIYFSNRKFN